MTKPESRFSLYKEPLRTIPHNLFRDNYPVYDELEKRPRMPVVAMFDNIRSMFNVGSMFRTADAAWLEEIVIGGFTASPPRKEIAKTALGAEYSVPWRYVPKAVDALKALKQKGYVAVALEHTTQSRSYTQVEYDFPLIFVVGNEGVGIQDEIVSECDFAVELPQNGMKSSMNVAVAFGIMLFELRRQWDSRG
ncbi:MAG: RNA methyltransferase [Candidatus Marinimicrobia bacterium]|nr:RNA methyltransferase [Candidatus Neomarinimicrobiota bacterium]